MTARRLAAALAAIALVGCSGSDNEPELVPDSTSDTIVSNEELLDGAFEANDGQSEAGDDPSTTESQDDADITETTRSTDDGPDANGGDTDADTDGSGDTNATTSVPDQTDTGGGSITDDATDSTGAATTSGDATTGSETTDGSTSGDATTTTTTSGGATTDGDTTTGGGAATDSATGSGATTGGTGGDSTTVGSTGEIESLTGRVSIGDDVYTFPIDGCNVLNEETSASGGATRDGIPFIVFVTSSLIDLNDDGADERTIEINVETNPDAEGEHPDFYVVGIDSTSMSTKFDIDFSVTPERITASGPIEDLNRVAIGAGETLPMTADLRCN